MMSKCWEGSYRGHRLSVPLGISSVDWETALIRSNVIEKVVNIGLADIGDLTKSHKLQLQYERLPAAKRMQPVQPMSSLAANFLHKSGYNLHWVGEKSWVQIPNAAVLHLIGVYVILPGLNGKVLGHHRIFGDKSRRGTDDQKIWRRSVLVRYELEICVQIQICALRRL